MTKKSKQEFVPIEDQEELQKISDILDKIIAAVKANPELLKRFFFGEFTPLRFTQAAGNHAFDDHPELFGIDKWRGHLIRAWVHNRVKSSFSERGGWVIKDPEGLIDKIKLDK